jgi:hypothetical protein
VLQRRFGDCKDKSLLLVALLSELGIEARPALVSAARRERVAGLLPSILAFDHAIVRATVEGRELWLDPTRLHQRAAPEALACAPFGRALLVAAEQTELCVVPGCEAPEPDQVVRVRVDAREEAALFEVHTSYAGEAADVRRSFLRATARDELGRLSQNYYSSLYPSIEQLEPPTVEEDERSGRIEVRERYRVPGFWKERDGGRSASIEPLELAGSLVSPSVRVRRGPIALGHPMHVRYELDVVGSFPWSVTPAQERVLGPGVSLRSRVSAKGDTMRLEWVYRTSAPEVPAESVDEYADWLERAQEELSWTLTPPSDEIEAEGPDLGAVRWALVLALGALFVLALGSGVALWLVDPGFGRPAQPPAGPTGLGGWCILLGLRLATTPLGALGVLAGLAPVLGGGELPPGHPAALLLVSAALWTAVLPLGLVLVAAFFARKRCFVPGFLVLSLLLVGAQLLGAGDVFRGADPGSAIALSQSLLWTVVWAVYALRSRRVRNTFVR